MATAGLTREPPPVCNALLPLSMLQGPGLEELRPLTSLGCSGLFYGHTSSSQIDLSGERAECLPCVQRFPSGLVGPDSLGEERITYIKEFETPFHAHGPLTV